MKDKKNKQKLVFKIISVFAAIVLWMVVTYTEDALMDINLNSLEVQYRGEQNLLSNGLMVVDKDSTPKASVKIRGRRGDLIAVMDGVRASVDLSSIESAGTYDLTPTFDIPSSAVYVSKRNTLSVKVNVAKIVEKTVDVVVLQENADKNKSYVIEAVPNIDKIRVRGEMSDIAQIGQATLYFDVTSVAESGQEVIKPVFETANGEKINFKNEVLTDFDEINVEYNVYDKKTVEVVVKVPFGIDANHTVKLIKQSIDKIDVGIIDEKGEMVESVTAELDDVSELVFGTQEYTLELAVPDGIYIPENIQKIKAEFEVSSNVVIQ